MCSPDGFQVRSEVEVGQNLLSCFWRLNNTTSILTSLIILKSRDITLPRMAHLVKAMVFPVVMYGCEIWTMKKAEHQTIDVFELWCWRRLLRVPWAARRSNQAILKEISPRCSLEGMMLKLKLQYFGHLMRRVDSLKKILMLGVYKHLTPIRTAIIKNLQITNVGSIWRKGNTVILLVGM